VSREERLELDVGDQLDRLRGTVLQLRVALRVELLCAIVEVPGALKHGVLIAVWRYANLFLLLANVGVGEPRGTLAARILIDNRWRAAADLGHPDAIGLVDNGGAHGGLLANILDHVGIGSSAFSVGILVRSGACITIVSAKSDSNLVTAPEGCDFVVPAVSVGLPVLLVGALFVLIDVVQAEVVLTALEVSILVDSAALWGGTLFIFLVLDTANVTHGSFLLVLGEANVVVDEDVLPGVSTLLGVATTSDAGHFGHPLRVVLRSFLRDYWVVTHIVPELKGLRRSGKRQ